MPEFFVLLLMQVTIFSSVTALILIAVKQLFKCRIQPFVGAVLWIILLARLVCPIYPESRISIYNFIPAGRDIMFSLTNDIGDELEQKKEQYLLENNPYVVHRDEDILPEEAPESIAENSGAGIDGAYYTEAGSANLLPGEQEKQEERINRLILIVYGAGIFVTMPICICLYVRAKRRALRTSVLCEKKDMLLLYHEIADALGFSQKRIPPLRIGESPMLIGCWKPQIVCRDDLDKKEMRMIFAHELIHCKYWDNPILLFSACVACFFWYNPLIWIVRRILREDLEVLCDERTLTYCRIPRTDYAMMLCRSCAYAELAVGAGCHMSAAGRRLKNRLRTISSGNKHKFLPKAASILLCAAIIMICLTNPIVSQNSDYSTYIENFAQLTGGDVRAMHLSQQETVSSYLSQLAVVLKEWYGEPMAHAIGNGSLERFKRLCAAWDMPKDLLVTVQMLRTDEPLTMKNCAVLNACAAAMIDGGRMEQQPQLRLLPQMITEADMQSVLARLTQTEAGALLMCYNRGVQGAEVSLELFYTEAMMELICSRINNLWLRGKFSGFYRPCDPEELHLSAYSHHPYRALFASLEEDDRIYICDPTITSVEEAKLAEILGAAYAGQQEDVYYLKTTEDGCTFEIAERLMKRGGFTIERMLDGYARIGEAPQSSVNSSVAFAVVRTDEPAVAGIVLPDVADAVRYAYSLGLADASEGVIDLTEKLSCGQGIAYAYRFAAAIVPADE